MSKLEMSTRRSVILLVLLTFLGGLAPSATAMAAVPRQAPGSGWFKIDLPAPQPTQLVASTQPPGGAPSLPSNGATTESLNASGPTFPVTTSAPGDFVVYDNHALTPPSAPSEQASPAAANRGRDIFATFNNYAAFSTDYGSTWSYIDPAAQTYRDGMTSWQVHGGFNGNQDVFYDQSRDLMVWVLQYAPDSFGNALRVAWTKGQNELETLYWFSTPIEPTTYCGGTDPNSRFDRPQLARTSNYLYLGANVYDSTNAFLCTTLIRFSLDNMAAESGLTIFGYYETGAGSFTTFTPAQGGTDTLYFAQRTDTTHLRVYQWPESAEPIGVTFTDVTHLAFIDSGYDCTVTASGKNPCAGDDGRIRAAVVWGMSGSSQFLDVAWDAAQGQMGKTDALGAQTYPYVRYVTLTLPLSTPTQAPSNDTGFWDATKALFLPFAARNARGHAGGTVATAGGSNQPGCSAWISDDYNSGGITVQGVQTGTDSPSGNAWGDYLRARQSGLNPFQWVGTCYAIESGVVTPRVIRFGRGRDTYSHMKVDFNVDGTTDVAVFRPATAGWFIKNQFALNYGLTGDDPLPYDFNGDGRADVAVFRPSQGSWFVRNQFATYYGLPGDVPIPGDYNGDGIADLAVYRPSTSAWYVRGQFATVFGLPGDIPVPGDYNGDGMTDIGVFRPSTGGWYIKNIITTIFGLPGDIPIAGDFNGDGTTDLAVFRPSNNEWFVRGQFATGFGLSGDLPVPGDYNADGAADIAVYRPSTSAWFVQGQFSTVYGIVGDYPLPAPDTNADGDPYQ